MFQQREKKKKEMKNAAPTTARRTAQKVHKQPTKLPDELHKILQRHDNYDIFPVKQQDKDLRKLLYAAALKFQIYFKETPEDRAASAKYRNQNIDRFE